MKWLDRDVYHVPHLILVLSPEALNRTYDHLGVKNHDRHAWPETPATTLSLDDVHDGEPVCIVCLNPKDPKSTGIDIAACLVHEAWHVVKKGFNWIGEDNPGEEITAYALQYTASRLMHSYVEQTRRRKK